MRSRAPAGDVFGADAVLYVTVDEYGSKYQVIAANTIVRAHAKLVDAQTGSSLWGGQVVAQAAGRRRPIDDPGRGAPAPPAQSLTHLV